MTTATKLIIYNRECHFDVKSGQVLTLGDKFEAVRGNGPREGDHMGTATVVGFDDEGGPELEVHIDGGETP
jgi:hypothetical protein